LQLWIHYKRVMPKRLPTKHLTTVANIDNWPCPALAAALLALVVAALCVWLILDDPVADVVTEVLLPLLPNSVVDIVAADPDTEVGLTATEIDPTSPVVVADAPDVLVAVALTPVLAGPNFSAPAVTPTGKYVISAGPSVEVTSSVVLNPLSVWLSVHTACVVPAKLHAMLAPPMTICIVEGPSITVAPPP
jgi:hypothetical protein